MKKFILVDQSLKNFQGHHFEYSVSVAEAAREKGLDVSIYCHQDFKQRKTASGIPIRSWFDRAWHESRGLLLFKGAGRLKRIFRKFAKNLSHLSSSIVLTSVHVIVNASPETVTSFAKAKKAFGVFGPLLSLGKHISRISLLIAENMAETTARSIFSIYLGLLEMLYPSQFGKKINKIVKAENLKSEDIVFIHTVSFFEFYDLLRTLKKNTAPSIHVVLRRDSDEVAGDSIDRTFLVLAARLYRKVVSSVNFVIYSDTQPLVEAYRSYGFDVDILPIPFRTDLLDRHIKRDQGKFIISYLGDARSEKRYDLLPSLANYIWLRPELRDRVEFHIQSNFNMPGGETGIPQAKAELSRYPKSFVKLYENALSPDEYYQLLGQSSVLVIPYDPVRYSKRSSGVYAEAAAAGIPTVVPNGSWMAQEQGPAEGEAFTSAFDMCVATEKIFRNPDFYQEKAAQKAVTWRNFHNPSSLVEKIISRSRSQAVLPPPLQKTILHFAELQYLVEDSGAGYICRNQLEYFRSRNIRVIGIYYISDFGLNTPAVNDLVRRGRETLEKYGIEMYWILRPSNSLANLWNIFKINFLSNKKILSFRFDSLRRKAFSVPRSLKTFLRNNRGFEAVYMNYVATMDLVEKLGIKDIPIICETHDIQSYQYATYNKSAVNPDDFALETAAMAKCKRLLFINPLEAQKIQEVLPKVESHFVQVPYRPTDKNRTAVSMKEALSGALKHVQVLGKLHWSYGELVKELDSKSEFISNMSSIDCIFVSSDHEPNIVSFDWFLWNVNPILLEKGISVVVIGSIFRKLLSRNLPKNIICLGHVNDLHSFNMNTKTIIVPNTVGEGSSIKFIDALGQGKPVIANSRALRGFEQIGTFPFFDHPNEFANAIIRSLREPDYAKFLADEAARLLEVCSVDQYRQKMDSALDLGHP